MIKKIIFLFPIIFLTFFTYSLAGEYIHPYNKILMKLYPRPFKLRFPDVPRITAKEALMLYKSNQAFFIHIGDEGWNVPGCLHFRENKAFRINPNKLFRLIPQKYVILYCH